MAVRILIVDDSPVIRRSMRLVLEGRPEFEVCGEADNGQTAVEMFRNLQPDFVVLDFSMPVMNGLEAAREMAEIRPGVPLLMCTMFKSEQLVKEAQQAGVKRVVSKSEKLSSNLITTIEQLLQGSNAA